MAEVVSHTMAFFSRRWLVLVEALGSDSVLLSEASASQHPQQHLLRVIQKYAPSSCMRIVCAPVRLRPARGFLLIIPS